MDLKKNWVKTILQVVLGCLLILPGINKVYPIFELPEQSIKGLEFLNELYETGYLMYLIAAVEVLAGLSFLLDQYARLATLAALPVTLNILLFHIFLDPGGLYLGIIIFGLNLYFVFYYFNSYWPLLKP